MFIHHNTTIALMMFSWTAHFTRYSFSNVFVSVQCLRVYRKFMCTLHFTVQCLRVHRKYSVYTVLYSVYVCTGSAVCALYCTVSSCVQEVQYGNCTVQCLRVYRKRSVETVLYSVFVCTGRAVCTLCVSCLSIYS